ncbi:endonuclease [Lelliottia phage phD2B]|uniref:Putative homing endonuclease n=1 Tax=Lelliottia phage phD2B TaxID=1542498 RepID=A0A088FWM4_9CAUD|nr:endonuclease [Lelliottia phage phD2B]AIM51247.1 putative homing endonuclease [Lelliottia phage phD2B]
MLGSNCIDHGKLGFGLGYASGKFYDSTGKIRNTTMHRIAYCNANGINPEDLGRKVVLRHKCDNPRCINPEHLEVGTHKENSDDMKGRGRSKTNEQHWNCQLTQEAIDAIRKAYATGKAFQRQLAERYGVAQSHISRIVRGEQRGSKTKSEGGS